MRVLGWIATGLAAGLAALGSAPVAAAGLPIGKPFTIVVGYAPGGGYDAYARLAADHLGKYLPGHPTVLVENMEGGGARRSEVYLATAAPRDGTVIGLVASSIALESVQRIIPGDVDAAGFGFIGRLSNETLAIITGESSPTKTLSDAKARETILAGTSFGDVTTIVPRVVNATLGTRLKIVDGYRGSSEMVLAMERGEVEGITLAAESVKTLHPDWLEKKTVNFLSVAASQRYPGFPDVPALAELVPGDSEARTLIEIACSPAQIGKSLATPPGVPAETVAAWRQAFDAMIKDPDFRADAARRKLGLDTATGEDMQRTVANIMATPPAAVAKLKHILAGS